MTNREIAENNPTFRRACELAGIPATKRQAGKWERQTGIARQYRNQALSQIAQEKAGKR